MELAPVPGETMSTADIDRRLLERNKEFQELFAASKGEGGYLKYAGKFKRIADNMAALKEKKAVLLEQQNSSSAAGRRIQDAVRILENGSLCQRPQEKRCSIPTEARITGAETVFHRVVRSRKSFFIKIGHLWTCRIWCAILRKMLLRGGFQP